MSSFVRPAFRASRQSSICSACAYRSAVSGARWSSTEVAPPALLSKIKGDLKAAMKAKDAARLNVLRAIITEANNAAKTSSPIRSDLQVLAMLKKRKTSSEAAQQGAREVKREDIAEKEQAEIDVIDEYAGSVQMMTEEDIKSSITGMVDQMKSAAADTKAGQVLKEIFKTGGVLDGKAVERSQVAKIVNDLLGGK